MVQKVTSRWRGKRTWILVSLFCFPFVVIFLLTRSVILTPIVDAVLSNQLGVNVQVYNPAWEWSGGISIDEIILIAEDVEGEAGDIVSIRDISIEFDSFLPINPTILTIGVDSVLVRISESSENAGEFNFSHLFTSSNKTEESQTSEPEDSSQGIFPSVTVNTFAIETGEMNAGKWIVGGTKVFNVTGIIGSGTPTSLQLVDQKDDLNAELTFGTSPMHIVVSFKDVPLDQSLFEMLPKTPRTWCDAINLTGKVQSIDFSFSSSNGVSIETYVDTMEFDLPEEHSFPWAVYKDGDVETIHGGSSIKMKNGKIKYEGEKVTLNTSKAKFIPSKLVSKRPLEFSIALKVYQFGTVVEGESEKWLDAMLKNSPFSVDFIATELIPEKTVGEELIVPMHVGKVLELFNLVDWQVKDIGITVKRLHVGETVKTGGSFQIHAGEGAFMNFPYPLKELKSYIEFDNDNISIRDLIATGSGSSLVKIKGQVASIADEDNIKVGLNLKANNAPLDNDLRKALSGNLRSLMDDLIDREVYERLYANTNALDDCNFKLGGNLDLDLNIKYDKKMSDDVELSGEFWFKKIGILHKDFPYPVVLEDGIVKLDKHGVHIPKDLFIKFKGCGGGEGHITGDVIFMENGYAAPMLIFRLVDEDVNDVLLTAISESSGEAHELASGVLKGLGLESKVTIKGEVKGREGDINTNFTGTIKHGIIRPNEQLAKAIGATGSFWPEGFEFSGVDAIIHVENGNVSMKGATCKCNTGSLTVKEMTVNKGDFKLEVEGVKLPISPQFVDVLPLEASEKLSESWQWLEPSGVMDVDMSMSRIDETDKLEMTVHPSKLIVIGLDGTTELELKKGVIKVNNANVTFDELKFALSAAEKPQGELLIGGKVKGDEGKYQYDIKASWEEAVIESPLVRAITGIVGGEGGVDYYDSINPSGKASATLKANGNDESIDYNIEIIPTELSTTFHDETAVALFKTADEAQCSNVIRFNNSGIYFDYLSGMLGNGEFKLDGKITTSEPMDGKFDLTWKGPPTDESLFAILPKILGETFKSIELSGDNIPSEITNGIVSFSGDTWNDVSVDFTGDILIEDVSIDIGIPLEKIKGKIVIAEGKYVNKQLSSLKMKMEFNELSTLGRKVTDISGGLIFDSSISNKFVFDNLIGDSSNGRVSVGGWLSMDEPSKDYEVEILVAGVDLDSLDPEKVPDEEKLVASLTGELLGWISIAGVQGETASRRGVGLIRVENGSLPIKASSLTALRLSQLSLPSNETITGAEIDLYLEGNHAVLERITLRSDETDITDLVIKGEGEIDLDTFQINARLHPRVGLPIIRDIAGAFNDFVYSIDVTGELLDPTVSVIALPALSQQKNNKQ